MISDYLVDVVLKMDFLMVKDITLHAIFPQNKLFLVIGCRWKKWGVFLEK